MPPRQPGSRASPPTCTSLFSAFVPCAFRTPFPHAPYPSASGGSLLIPLPAIRPGQDTPFSPGLQAVAPSFNRSTLPSPVAILRPCAANPTADPTLPYFHPISDPGGRPSERKEPRLSPALAAGEPDPHPNRGGLCAPSNA